MHFCHVIHTKQCSEMFPKFCYHSSRAHTCNIPETTLLHHQMMRKRESNIDHRKDSSSQRSLNDDHCSGEHFDSFYDFSTMHTNSCQPGEIENEYLRFCNRAVLDWCKSLQEVLEKEVQELFFATRTYIHA